ncbi:MAG: hypothetical protein U0N90_03120 [Blautia sp.]|jgi:hypothetical protein
MEKKQSFYEAAGNGKFYEQEAPVQQDRELLKSYYPRTAGLIQAFVEDACDRLDYEGSFIYDQYPDRHTMERVCENICGKIQESQAMQSMEKGNRGMSGASLGEITGILFCQEMHRRRCRRKRFRSWFRDFS